MLSINDEIGNRKIRKDYLEHDIFSVLQDIIDFYDLLSYNSFFFVDNSLLTSVVQNLDTSVFDAMCGTIESIKMVLGNGRINDAYSLLRKYDDAIMVDAYMNIILRKENDKFIADLLKDEASLQNNIKESMIRAWVKFSKKLYKQTSDMAKEIGNDPTLYKVSQLIKGSESFKHNRNICNDNVHYNSWSTFVLNNFHLINTTQSWKKHLDKMKATLIQFFALHFSYIYILHPEFYVASDYVDSLDCGITPPESTMNWVASFVQTVFDKYVKPFYPDAAEYLVGLKILELK